MRDFKSSLPSITRLNTVRHEGVPLTKAIEHYCFCYESTQLIMEFRDDWIVSVRGNLSSVWHPRWTRLFSSPFFKEARNYFMEVASFVVMDWSCSEYPDSFFDEGSVEVGSHV